MPNSAKDKKTQVLLVEDDANLRKMTANELRRAGFDVVEVWNGEQAVNHLDKKGADVVLLDLRLAGSDGTEVLRDIHERQREAEVVIITAYSTVQSAITCMKLGAYDYIEKPYEMERLIHTIEKAAERKSLCRERSLLRQEIRRRAAATKFIGSSRSAVDVVELARKAASVEASVLITGESGTGKEVLAKLVHDWSARNHQPFITVDCGTLHPDLIGRELFGPLKGSFTGATDTRHGLVEVADNGTLFVDEIGDLPI